MAPRVLEAFDDDEAHEHDPEALALEEERFVGAEHGHQEAERDESQVRQQAHRPHEC